MGERWSEKKREREGERWSEKKREREGERGGERERERERERILQFKKIAWTAFIRPRYCVASYLEFL